MIFFAYATPQRPLREIKKACNIAVTGPCSKQPYYYNF